MIRLSFASDLRGKSPSCLWILYSPVSQHPCGLANLLGGKEPCTDPNGAVIGLWIGTRGAGASIAM